MPKQPSRRYRVDAHPAGGSKWVRLGRNHFAQSVVLAKFVPLGETGIDESAPTVEMLVSIGESGSPRVDAVSVVAPDDAGLSPEAIRIPLRAMMRAAVASQAYRLEGDAAVYVSLPGPFTIGARSTIPEQVNAERFKAMERDIKRAPANQVTDDELRRTAEIVRSVPYRERREAVRRELNVSLPVAKARIAAARKRFPEEFKDA